MQRLFQQKQALLLSGAGISLDPAAGLPDWYQLRDHTLDAVAGQYPTPAKFAPVLKAVDMLAQPW